MYNSIKAYGVTLKYGDYGYDAIHEYVCDVVTGRKPEPDYNTFFGHSIWECVSAWQGVITIMWPLDHIYSSKELERFMGEDESDGYGYAYYVYRTICELAGVELDPDEFPVPHFIY